MKLKFKLFNLKLRKDWKCIDILGFTSGWNYGSLLYISKDYEFFDFDFLFIGAFCRWIHRKK